MSEYTQKELDSAAADMLLASMDYDDNSGSDDRYEFWNRFEAARAIYKHIKKNIENSELLESDV